MTGKLQLAVAITYTNTEFNDSIHQTNNLITFHCLRVDVITVILLEVANLHAAAALGK
jgi:hypothetical protein